MGSNGKESVCNVGGLGLIPGSEDPLEKGMATNSSILAWRIPWTEEPGSLQSMVLQESDATYQLNHYHHPYNSLYIGCAHSLGHVCLFVTPWTVCSSLGSSVHGIFQARILEWIAISSSRRSSPPRDQNHVFCEIGRAHV